MSVTKTKKYAFVGLSLMLLAFLLLALAGCDTSSDPKIYYQATGSWQGTIGADRVRGIIAPDGSYQLAIVDVNGDFIPGAGDYVGKIGSINPDNIGSMSLTRLQPDANSYPLPPVTFILSATQLKSDQGIMLTRTPDANGPAAQGDVAGHWSILTDAVTTNVVVDADGNISGGDRVNCQYSGSVNLIDPAWNIYNFNLSTSNYPGKSCLNSTSYNGLAMKLIAGEPRPLFWFAASSGAKTFLGAWTETINVAPIAVISILGDRTSTGPESSVLVKEGAGAAVVLDAQGSSDDNLDLLTYTWSGTDPDGNALTITIDPGTESVATFVPLISGLYSIVLSVSDGISTVPLTRPLLVEWTPARFVDCANGTVLDTKTNLVWLQDAGCIALNLEDTVDGPQWGVSHALALERVGTLSSGVCGQLSDNSAAGAWRLPTLSDFSYIVPESQWSSEGNLFVNVGTNPDPQGAALPYYWTADPDPLTESSWFYVDTSAAPAEWFESYFENNRTAVWPVRSLQSGETCP